MRYRFCIITTCAVGIILSPALTERIGDARAASHSEIRQIMSSSNPSMPDWVIPDDLDTILTDEGMWESDQWQPVMLTVMGDTVYQGRPIPQAWQIEFSPHGPEFAEANRRLAAAGKTPDAYGWRDLIVSAMADHAPALAGGLHTDDTEAAALVIWVESEEACKALMEVIWKTLHP